MPEVTRSEYGVLAPRPLDGWPHACPVSRRSTPALAPKPPLSPVRPRRPQSHRSSGPLCRSPTKCRWRRVCSLPHEMTINWLLARCILRLCRGPPFLKEPPGVPRWMTACRGVPVVEHLSQRQIPKLPLDYLHLLSTRNNSSPRNNLVHVKMSSLCSQTTSSKPIRSTGQSLLITRTKRTIWPEQVTYRLRGRTLPFLPYHQQGENAGLGDGWDANIPIERESLSAPQPLCSLHLSAARVEHSLWRSPPAFAAYSYDRDRLPALSASETLPEAWQSS